jgi:type I restriction enzyme S subunit
MIDALKPYPSMKDSGVPWLGEMADHWSLRRTRTVLLEERNFASDRQVT